MPLRYLRNVATIALDPEHCLGCGLCVQVCPHGVIAMAGGKAVIADRDACMECGACARNCAAGALVVQAGVGCAQAVINAALGRTGGDCCCSPDARQVGGVGGGGGCC
jgi:NAD-dependent dihydropyrimidine dehydrogenase PreA subunit